MNTTLTRAIVRTVSLDGPAWRESLPGLAYQGEQNAHRFFVRAERDGGAVPLSGAVLLKWLRADGVTVDVPGEIEDGAAAATLSGNCYAVMGPAEMTLFVTLGGATAAIYAAKTVVTRTRSGQEVSGGDVIDLPALQAEYEAMRAARAAAEAAAEGVGAAFAAMGLSVAGGALNITYEEA